MPKVGAPDLVRRESAQLGAPDLVRRERVPQVRAPGLVRRERERASSGSSGTGEVERGREESHTH